MSKLEIIWEGKILLDDIQWNEKITNKYEYSQEYNIEAEKYWNDHIKAYPNDYDGNLVYLNKFHYIDNKILLDISLIKFSIVNYIIKKKLHLKGGFGVLGTQYLILSPNSKYVLVGRRSLSQNYFPSALTFPGGILESSDLTNPPKIALTRELKEEVALPLKSNSFLLAILGGWNNVSITFLISTIINENYNFDPNKTISSDATEWAGNLRWLSIKTLQNMSNINFLDGLTYYQLKIVEEDKQLV